MSEYDYDSNEIILNGPTSLNRLLLNDLIENKDDTNFVVDYLKKYFKLKNKLIKEFLAECLGTFILVLIALGSSAQLKFSSKDDPLSKSTLSANIAGGFGVTTAVLLVGKISGAHLNPAVSFAMLISGRLRSHKFFIYLVAQFLGAFLSACATYLVYLDALNSYKEDKYSLKTADIFSTYPSKNLSLLGGFLDQLVATGFLVMVILAITDKKNVKIPHATVAILVGLTLVVIGCTFGYNCGSPLNPARDLSPRFFTFIAGWGSKTFTAGDNYFWIPIIGPMVGSMAGSFIYLILISIQFD